MRWRLLYLDCRCPHLLGRGAQGGRGWIHEIKHDGSRIVARRSAGGVRLGSAKRSRNPSVSDDDAQNWRCRWGRVAEIWGADQKVVASRLCALRASTSAVRQADRLRAAAHPVVNIRTSEHHIPSRPRLSVWMFGSLGKKGVAHGAGHRDIDFVRSPPCKLPPNCRERGIISVREVLSFFFRPFRPHPENNYFDLLSCGAI